MEQMIYNLISTAPEILTDEQMSEVLSIIPTIEKWIRDVKEYALRNTMETGAIYPGFELKEYSRRRIENEELALAAIRDYDPDLYNQCVRPQSFSQLEKVMGQHLFERLLTPYIVHDKSMRIVKEKK